MSARLHRLEVGGRKLVTPELARGEIDRLPESATRANVEPFARAVDLAELDAALSEVRARTPAHDAAAIDGLAAPMIHAALRLTRREAADLGVWRWLAVVHRPDFVRHRWEFRSWSTMLLMSAIFKLLCGAQRPQIVVRKKERRTYAASCAA